MTKSGLVLLVVILASGSLFSQEKTGQVIKPETIELITPWVFDGEKASYSQERSLKSCLDFNSLSHDCSRTKYPAVWYGNRAGINWDIFNIHGGRLDRTRMVEIGRFNWTDKFTVPEVEPWDALAPGETRTIYVNTNGGNAAPEARGSLGANGVAVMNGDGTYAPIPRPIETKPSSVPKIGKSYATANVNEQVGSTVKDKDGKVRSDPYSPVLEVKKDYMYVVHVVEETRDYYVLVHVDNLVRGERISLSFIKLEFVNL